MNTRVSVKVDDLEKKYGPFPTKIERTVVFKEDPETKHELCDEVKSLIYHNYVDLEKEFDPVLADKIRELLGNIAWVEYVDTQIKHDEEDDVPVPSELYLFIRSFGGRKDGKNFGFIEVCYYENIESNETEASVKVFLFVDKEKKE